jgi:hypothetical protein
MAGWRGASSLGTSNSVRGTSVHSKERIQGRHYTPEGTRRKKDVIRTGDILQLKIVDYLVDPVLGRVFPVHGTITCQV